MNDNDILIKNKIKELKKGVLELAVLKIISGRERYGYDIVEILKDGSLATSEGTIYPLLTRLKNEDLIVYKWEESDKGPPRKYYTISKKGREIMEELLNEWRKINSGLSNIIGGR